MDRAPQDEPLGAANFRVEIDDLEIGCSAVLGLGFASREQRVAAVTLRRSAGTDTTLWRWAREPDTRTVRVTLLGLGGEPVCRYVLRGARPEHWSGPLLDGLSGDVAQEELVLSAEGLDLESAG